MNATFSNVFPARVPTTNNINSNINNNCQQALQAKYTPDPTCVEEIIIKIKTNNKTLNLLYDILCKNDTSTNKVKETINAFLLENNLNFDNLYILIKYAILNEFQYFNPTFKIISELLEIKRLIKFYESEHLSEDFLLQLSSFLDKIVFLFMFHFDSQPFLLAINILKLLLNFCDNEFELNTLKEMLNLLKLLFNKRKVSQMIPKIYTNIAGVVQIILLNANISQESINYFNQFLLKEQTDLLLLFVIITPFYKTNKSNGFAKILTPENNVKFIEKYSNDLEKQVKNIIALISNVNNSTLNIDQFNKVARNSLNVICAFSFMIDIIRDKDNKQYNYSNFIAKVNDSLKNLWNVLLCSDEFIVII